MTPKPVGVAPAVLLVNPKYERNVAGALRACSCYDVKQLWWTGSRVTFDPATGQRLPREERMKGYKEVECHRHERPFDFFAQTPHTPVCIELCKGAEPLTYFDHPDDAVYVFGPEDGSVTNGFKRLCHRFVYLPSNHCLNLAVAIGAVLTHRRISRQLAGKDAVLPLDEMLKEHRGQRQPTPVLDAMGWDGG
jgi:tRNA(Leu) C34 or U34 (ribose-2'-O)-methylase TrmL